MKLNNHIVVVGFLDCSCTFQFKCSIVCAFVQFTYRHNSITINTPIHSIEKLQFEKSLNEKKCNLRSSHSQWVWTIDCCVYERHNRHATHISIETMRKTQTNRFNWLTECIMMHWTRRLRALCLLSASISTESFICDDDRLHIQALNSSLSIPIGYSFLAVKIHFNLFDVQRWLVAMNNSWTLKKHTRTFTRPFWAYKSFNKLK